jgi:predicted aspartyl protease
MQVNVVGLVGRSRDELEEVEFVVDTGSFYSAISPAMGRRLNLPAGVMAQVMMADSRIVDTEVTLAYLTLLGRNGVVPVEVIEVPVPLLGVSALETLGMKVNPVLGELEIVRPFEAPPMFKRFYFGEDDA